MIEISILILKWYISLFVAISLQITDFLNFCKTNKNPKQKLKNNNRIKEMSDYILAVNNPENTM